MSDQRPTTDDFELIGERCQGVACSVSGDRRDPIDAIDALSDVVFDLARLTARILPEPLPAQTEVDQLQFGKLRAENARLSTLADELRNALRLVLNMRVTGRPPNWDWLRDLLARADAEAKR